MKTIFLRLNFLLVASGFFGSLYFSEVLKYPPCTLCWYQRICLYPLVVILGTALWTEDSNYRLYSLPLASLGFVIATYHNLVYYGFISEAIVPCTEGVSCSSKQLELWGFVTIPLFSLICFVLIIALLIKDKQKKRIYEQ